MGLMESMRRTATLACLAGLLAACGSSGPAASPGTSSTAMAVTPFVSIVEPFDPGHPARVETTPARCEGQGSTLAIERCYETRTENVDAEINAAQAARYAKADAAGRAAILAQDRAWLAVRGPVCHAAFTGGGTAAGVSAAACLLDESNARLAWAKGKTPPEALLNATDSTDPNQLSWYTTPKGSRIAELSTQGDQTGGAVVTWIIIGGAEGFVVNPRQFFFQDASFTDPGVVRPPDPTYHRVATGQEYRFSIDYSQLAKDPSGDKRGSGYVYAPGAPTAIWI